MADEGEALPAKTGNKLSLMDIPYPRTVTVSLEAFYLMRPFSGHRNSSQRAMGAKHLHRFSPDHLRCEAGHIGPLPENIASLIESDPSIVRRFTGNTRAEVWAQGLSDQIPDRVILDVYECRDVAHMRELGVHFDSIEAAWTRKDHDFRAIGIAYEDEGWRPRSAPARNAGLLGSVARQARAYNLGGYRPDGVPTTARAIAEWAKELQVIDMLCDVPTSDTFPRDFRPYRVGIMTAVALLLRYEPDETEAIIAWCKEAMSDAGTKTTEGMDGVQYLVETMLSIAQNVRSGRSSIQFNVELAKKVIAGYLLHRDGRRTMRMTAKVDPVDYCRLRSRGEPVRMKVAT